MRHSSVAAASVEWNVSVVSRRESTTVSGGVVSTVQVRWAGEGSGPAAGRPRAGEGGGGRARGRPAPDGEGVRAVGQAGERGWRRAGRPVAGVKPALEARAAGR